MKPGAVVAGVAFAAGVLVWTFEGSPPRSDAPSDSVALPGSASAGAASLPVADQAQPIVGRPSSNGASRPDVSPGAAPLPPLGSNEVPKFEVDARGNLVIDAHTRDELERLRALNDRSAALDLLRRAAFTMPAIAHRQATDAYYAFENYSAALMQAFPAGQPVTNEISATQQLASLHAFRVQHFGADVAKAYFGQEEETAAALLVQMQAQPDDGRSLEERAERAQGQLQPSFEPRR